MAGHHFPRLGRRKTASLLPANYHNLRVAANLWRFLLPVSQSGQAGGATWRSSRQSPQAVSSL